MDLHLCFKARMSDQSQLAPHTSDCKVSNEIKWKWMSCTHREGVALGL